MYRKFYKSRGSIESCKLMTDVTDITGIGPSKADTLAENGFETVEDIATADVDELAAVDGVGDDRAAEFVLDAEGLLDTEEGDEDDEIEETVDEEAFDLTPESADEDEDPVQEVEETEDDTDETDEPYSVTLSFDSQLQYDVLHAALMRHHEDVYTSNQPASDATQDLLDGLGTDGGTYELTEFELNTLHTAIKQTRVHYQGENLIDHMDALRSVEQQVDDARDEYLF